MDLPPRWTRSVIPAVAPGRGYVNGPSIVVDHRSPVQLTIDRPEKLGWSLRPITNSTAWPPPWRTCHQLSIGRRPAPRNGMAAPPARFTAHRLARISISAMGDLLAVRTGAGIRRLASGWRFAARRPADRAHAGLPAIGGRYTRRSGGPSHPVCSRSSGRRPRRGRPTHGLSRAIRNLAPRCTSWSARRSLDQAPR
jgi:hypothetical protein